MSLRRREMLAVVAGSVFGSPSIALTQQKAPVIGFLHFGSPEEFAAQVADFHRGLGELGYIEGQNVAIEYRWAEGHYAKLPELAANLVRRGVDVITAISDPAALAAKAATATIPIAFMVGSDPIKDRLIASLARPESNLTGLSFLFSELHGKRLELLSELLPHAKVIAVLRNPTFADSQQILENVQVAAHAMGLALHILNASTDAETEAAFATLSQRHADGLLVVSDPLFDSLAARIVARVASHLVPAIYPWRLYTTAGGLISYGPDLTDVSRQLGVYTGKLLKGERPSDLPVQQPTRFELVVNLKTAKALGLEIPPSILARADEVLE